MRFGSLKMFQEISREEFNSRAIGKVFQYYFLEDKENPEDIIAKRVQQWDDRDCKFLVFFVPTRRSGKHTISEASRYYERVDGV